MSLSNHATFTAAHRPFAAVYADSAARLAATGFPRGEGGTIIAFAADDLYKEALQLTDASRWILTNHSPITWTQTSGTGSVGVDNSTIEISGGNLRVKDAGISNAKLANMAAHTFKGNNTGSSATPIDLTATQLTAELNAMVGDSGAGGTKGLVPAPGVGDAAAGKFLKASGSFEFPTQAIDIPFLIDGGGSVISTGIRGDIGPFDYAATIQKVTLLADQSGSIVIDIWKDTYANFPPTGADSITASAKPTISSATKSQDGTLTGWTTSIAAGDILRINVDSVSTIQRVTMMLKVLRTS